MGVNHCHGYKLCEVQYLHIPLKRTKNDEMAMNIAFTAVAALQPLKGLQCTHKE